MTNPAGIGVEAGLAAMVAFHVVKYVAPVWRAHPGREARAAIAEPMYVWWFSERSWWRYQRSALWIDAAMLSVAIGGIARLSLGAETGPRVFDLVFKPLLIGFVAIAGVTCVLGWPGWLVPPAMRGDRDPQ